MRLPGAERAIVDIEKLREYCLNHRHPRGRHKARVFASALQFFQADAEFLSEKLLRAADESDATESEVDEYGRRYFIDFELIHGHLKATVRSTWIMRFHEDFPRLVTCFYYGVSITMADLELLSVVAITEDLFEKGLKRGQVGTVVEILAPSVYEVEFSDDCGYAYATVPLRSSSLMRLFHEPKHDAA